MRRGERDGLVARRVDLEDDPADLARDRALPARDEQALAAGDDLRIEPSGKYSVNTGPPSTDEIDFRSRGSSTSP